MAVVGLERTFYQVSEDVGVVEVCAIVYSPTIDCPIAFPLDVCLSTENGSAGMTTTLLSTFTWTLYSSNRCCCSAVSPMDYSAVSTILMFAACQMRSCVNISIVNVAVLENIETFAVTLARTSGLDSRIVLNPVNGVVEIIDNDGECYIVLISG